MSQFHSLFLGSELGPELVEEPTYIFPGLEDDYLDGFRQSPLAFDFDTVSANDNGVADLVKSIDFEATFASPPHEVPVYCPSAIYQPSLLNTSRTPPPNLPVPYCDRIVRGNPPQHPVHNFRPVPQHQQVKQHIHQQEQKQQQASHPQPPRHPPQAPVIPPPSAALLHPPRPYTLAQTTESGKANFTSYATLSEAFTALQQKQQAVFIPTAPPTAPSQHALPPPKIQNASSPVPYKQTAATSADVALAAALAAAEAPPTAPTAPPQPPPSLPPPPPAPTVPLVAPVVSETCLRVPNAPSGPPPSSHPPSPPPSLPQTSPSLPANTPAPVASQPASPDLRCVEEVSKEVPKKPTSLLKLPPIRANPAPPPPSTPTCFVGFVKDVMIYSHYGMDQHSGWLPNDILIALDNTPLNISGTDILNQLDFIFSRKSELEHLLSTPFFVEVLRSGRMLIPFPAKYGYPLPECKITYLPFRGAPGQRDFLYSFAQASGLDGLSDIIKPSSVKKLIHAAWATLQRFQECHWKESKENDWFAECIVPTPMFELTLSCGLPKHQVRQLTRVQIAFLMLHHSMRQLPKRSRASSLRPAVDCADKQNQQQLQQQSSHELSREEFRKQKQQHELQQQQVEEQRRMKLRQLQKLQLQQQQQLQDLRQLQLLQEQQEQLEHSAQPEKQSGRNRLNPLVQHLKKRVDSSPVEVPEQPKPPSASLKRKPAVSLVFGEKNISIYDTDTRNKRLRATDQERKGLPAAIRVAEPVVETSTRRSKRVRSREQKRSEESEDSDAGKPLLKAKRKHSSTETVEDG